MASRASMSCSQSVSSTVTSIDRMFHNGLLDNTCNRLLEFHCHKAGKSALSLDSSARASIVDYIVDIIKNVCDPSVPNSISDVNDRIDFSFPSKLKPSDQVLEEIRLTVEKGKKRTMYLSPDKVFSCFKAVCPRIEPSVSQFMTHLIEHTMSQIIQWAVNYESKIQSDQIESTDIQHVFSVFGTPKLSKASVVQSLPFLHRRSSDYNGHAKELQFFLRSSVEHLGTIVRVFSDPIQDDLTQLALAAESTLSGASNGCSLAVSAGSLLHSVNAAQMVFARAAELYSHMTLLSECVDDVFESHSRLIGACLIEPAEDETFQSFAYYAEALFSTDCYRWTHLLTETPCLVRALSTVFQNILRTVMEKASTRRLADLESRFSDPHTCGLCTSSTGSDSGGGGSVAHSSVASYSTSSHSTESPHSFLSLGGSGARAHSSGTSGSTANVCSAVDPPGSIPVPIGSSSSTSAQQHNSRCPGSVSCHSFATSRQTRSAATTLSLQRRKKSWASRRSVSGSPSPPPHVPFSTGIRPSDTEYPNKQLSFPDKANISTSSSSSSALNEEAGKSGPDSGSHSFEPHGFIGTDGDSPGGISLKEVQARLMEMFPSNSYSCMNSASCNHMVIAFRYLLPQLLQLPVLQLLYLVEITEALYSHAAEENEQSMLKDVLSMLSKTRTSVRNSMSTEDWVKSVAPRLANFLKTPLSGSVLSTESKTKLQDLVQSVRRSQQSWERPISMSDFIMDGLLQTRTDGCRSRRSDRIAYLFNNWLLICKKQRRVLGTVVTSGASSTNSGLKLKNRIPLEQFHLIDLGTELTDNNEVLFTFDLEYWNVPRHITLAPANQSGSSVLTSHSTSTSGSGAVVEQHSLMSGSSQSTSTTGSHMGSVLSISTLTSSSTLTGAPAGTTESTAETEHPVFNPPLMPTAGAAAAAASAAMLGALSNTPKSRINFVFNSQESKADWMAALIYMQLSRLFKRYLRDLPRQEIPLVLPPPSAYRFAAPDSITNIILEPMVQDSSVEIPVIRAANIDKLVERMTYHAYFDSRTIAVFLLTFRRYITPMELLEHMIDRFNIPQPDFVKAAEATTPMNEVDTPGTIAFRLEKRFRSAYKRRVQYRVLNFLVKWVRNPVYYKQDILPNADLRKRFFEFLDSVDARNLADNANTIRKSLRGDRIRLVQTIQQLPPEQLDLGLVTCAEDVRLTNIHPVELARQITLYEWELYSRIEFWEVNGKERIKAPNLQASLLFSNKIKWWLVSAIMNTENMEDRVVVMQRIADLLILFEQLNNLQGVQEAKAALLSSPVFRLYDTYDALVTKSKPHHRAVFESLCRSVESEDLDAYRTDYEKKLHEVNPPGLPFIAVGGKTQLIHLELKHPDWITVPNATVTTPLLSSCGTGSTTTTTRTPGPDAGDTAENAKANTICLVNFWKCRQVANLVEYYLSFQQTPYNFRVNDHIRTFFENFDPLKTAGVEDEHGFDDLMHEKSLRYQPRPPAEPAPVIARQLSAVEQRIGTLLSLNPPDARLSVDSKEFRALLHCTPPISAPMTTNSPGITVVESRSSRSSLPVTQGESNAFGPSSETNLRPSGVVESVEFVGGGGTNSLGRGRSRPVGASSRVPTGRTQTIGTGGGTIPLYCRHNPLRGARSASSSPAPPAVCSSSAWVPPALAMNSSPPPLPPRTVRSDHVDRRPEQFINQSQPACVLLTCTDAVCEPQGSTTDSCKIPPNDKPEFLVPVSRIPPSELSDMIGQTVPPSLPPRPVRRRPGTVISNMPIANSPRSDIDSEHSKTRRITASVSPSPNLRLIGNSHSVVSHSSTGDSIPDLELSSDASPPPTLPPRIHTRTQPPTTSSSHSCSLPSTQHSSPLFSNPQCNSGVEVQSSVPLSSDIPQIKRSSPPPLPPKRQLSRGTALTPPQPSQT
ncbi:unnamed protein product [Calicophoron daubneyi]|uniref:Son of sevenless n=1 Tax=Calicophoron daubneyi TaxID=300641 RepID=A0AAV2T3X0_CALDB